MVGNVSWGTHLCLFYKIQEDLLDILIPYWEEGLKRGQLCIWATSEFLGVAAAKAALAKAVMNLDEYVKGGQIEIVDARECYTNSRKFDQDETLQDWFKKERQAVERGFTGVRVAGDTSWLEEEDWRAFADYEATLDNIIGKHRIVVICSHSLDKCLAYQIIDASSNHQGTLIKRQGKWEVIENLGHKRATEEALKRSWHEMQNGKLGTILEGMVSALASVAEKRDPYTAGHQQRVTLLACAIAGQMGLPEVQIDGIRVAGTLHDIGKMYVPAEILNKPGALAGVEMSLIRAHSEAGYDIVKGIEFPWPVAQAILQHHERLDGSGYPAGLSGEDIILEARVLGVADVVEAMCSHRPFRPALGMDKALEEISRHRGILYDPRVADACLKVFTEKGFRLEHGS
ncbi:MAG: MEDS domain-containing protein [Chloroflexi bacterium]|nr:MEDS domain-containing protein [Chloroflexota bacterium]